MNMGYFEAVIVLELSELADLSLRVGISTSLIARFVVRLSQRWYDEAKMWGI
jgi:hypothetical protein